MRYTAQLMAAAACFTLATAVSAQTRPDFAGRWTAEPEPTAPPRGGNAPATRPPDLGSGWGSPITITQDANRLTVEYAFFGRGDMQPPLKFVYALDGSETKNRVMMGRGMQDQTSRATWEGDRLVITTAHAFPDPSSGKPLTMEVKRTLSLESPTRLIVETVRAGVLGGPSSTTRTAFTKS